MDKIVELVKLGVDQIKGVPVKDFSSADRNEVMRKKFFELMGTDKFDVMKYNQHKYEIFQIIKESLQQTIANGEEVEEAFYNNFVEESNVALGDKKEFEIENDAYLTVGEISGNNWNLDRQRMDKGAVVTVPTKAFYIKIYEYFKRFMTGRMDFAELAEKVDRTIQKKKKDFVAEAFQSAVAGLPTGYAYSGSYNESSIQAVIDKVTAANYGAEVTLVGTKGALNKLQHISDAILGESDKSDYNQVGYLRRWKGYNCAELPTVFKENSITDFVFDPNKIYVLASGTKPVKLVNEGDFIVQETNDVADNQDMTKDFATIWKMGAVAIFNRLFGVITITV